MKVASVVVVVAVVVVAVVVVVVGVVVAAFIVDVDVAEAEKSDLMGAKKNWSLAPRLSQSVTISRNAEIEPPAITC